MKWMVATLLSIIALAAAGYFLLGSTDRHMSASCEVINTRGMTVQLFCTYDASVSDYRYFAEAACQRFSDDGCIATFWKDRSKVADQWPMTEEQADAIVAAWYKHNNRLLLCHVDSCDEAP
jgi:hypothetical protein